MTHADDINTPAGDEPAGESPIEEVILDVEVVDEVDTESLEEAAKEVEEDLDELTLKTREADEYLDLARRTQADFENFRKRAARDAAAAGERGVSKLVGELIGALDNFDLSLGAVAQLPETDPAHSVGQGFKLIRDQLIAGLERCGVEVEHPECQAFDPARHEAVTKVEADGVEANTITAVHQAGYLLGSTVIRPARVSVAG